MLWQVKYRERFKKFFRISMVPLVLLILVGFSALVENWRPLAPGIEYKDLSRNTLAPWSHIHVFRIDLAKNSLDSLLAKNFSKTAASAELFSEKSNALIAINGGFFDNNKRPLGLRISNRKQENPIKNISWWGIFYIKNQHAAIASRNNFKQDKKIDFALQSGPRLVINGKIPLLKPGMAERSALGIDENGQVLIVVTERYPMTTQDLASFMKNTLHAHNALNLDGGSSSQLIANIDTFRLDVPGFAQVSDAIIVKPRL
jgi:uncharacterized protein YigE (DUF2233 family)